MSEQNNRYTAQEMIEEAKQITRYDCYRASDMLYQAAEMCERCEMIQKRFAMTKTEREMIDFILRGDAGKEEK